jgi:hypothetical protein
MLGEIEAITEILPSWMEELKESYKEDEWAISVLSQQKGGAEWHKGM